LTDAFSNIVGTKVGKITFVASISGTEAARSEAPVTVITRGIHGLSALSAILPVGRAGGVGDILTLFSTIHIVIPPGLVGSPPPAAIGCRPAANPGLPVISTFQTTNPATNELSGTPNTPIDIPAGTGQTFLLTVQALAALTEDLRLDLPARTPITRPRRQA